DAVGAHDLDAGQHAVVLDLHRTRGKDAEPAAPAAEVDADTVADHETWVALAGEHPEELRALEEAVPADVDVGRQRLVVPGAAGLLPGITHLSLPPTAGPSRRCAWGSPPRRRTGAPRR